MKEIEEKCLRFVLKNYKQGVFDTRKALRNLKSKHNPSYARRQRRITFYRFGVAASLLLCIGIYLYQSMQHKDAWTQLATADNVMEYTLPDSTRVVLSPHSALCYQSDRFKGGQREVRMNGKIYFHVHRDEAHPFRATGQHATIKVLGTAFQIDERPDDSVTEVYVSSGRVLFAANGEAGGIVLTKQMQARLLPGKRMPQITEPPTPNPAAWAVGTFVYDSTPLAVVLKELSDYYHVELTATDTDKTLTAEFGTDDDLEHIVSLIEASLDINIEQK